MHRCKMIPCACVKDTGAPSDIPALALWPVRVSKIPSNISDVVTTIAIAGFQHG